MGTGKERDAWLERIPRLGVLALGSLTAVSCGVGSESESAAFGDGTVTSEIEVVTSSTLRFDIDGTPNVPGQSATFILSSNRAEVMWSYEVTASEPWVIILDGHAEGLPAGAVASVVASMDRAELMHRGPGSYESTIEFSDPNVPFGVAATMTVVAVVPPLAASGGRVSDGLVVLYDFEESAGTVVGDSSGVGTPLNLDIGSPNSVTWLSGAVRLAGDVDICSALPATKITSACRATNEITIEAWVTPSSLSQGGPARIVTISDGGLLRNVTLGHGGNTQSDPNDAYNARLRSQETTTNGLPGLLTGAGETSTDLQHVVFTRRADGMTTLYVDGDARATGATTGNFSSWDETYMLSLGNEIGASRPWSGVMHLVAIYDRALLASEVSRNLTAGTGDLTSGSIRIDPASDFVLFGTTGAVSNPETRVYGVTNAGTDQVAWEVTTPAPWIRLDGPTSGVLATGSSSRVTIGLDEVQVASLPSGVHDADILWRNTTNGFGDTQLRVRLTLTEPGSSSGRPGPSNTGPLTPGSLSPSGSITASVDGQVIENVAVSGTIRIQANNVTIRNFRIDGNGQNYGIHTGWGDYTGTVIEDGEILDIDSSGILGHNFTARRLNIHESGGDGIKARSNVLVENCWIHHLGMNPGAHADGNQTRGGSNIVFRRNNIDMPVGSSPNGTAGYLSNASLIIQDEVGPISHFLIEENWLNGGNFTIFLRHEQFGGPTDVTIINNRFGRDFRYGTFTADPIPFVAAGNVWDDTGEPLGWNNQ